MNFQDREAARGRENELAQDARALHTPSPSGSHNSEPRGLGGGVKITITPFEREWKVPDVASQPGVGSFGPRPDLGRCLRL
jgi:hypothetical protein